MSGPLRTLARARTQARARGVGVTLGMAVGMIGAAVVGLVDAVVVGIHTVGVAGADSVAVAGVVWVELASAGGRVGAADSPEAGVFGCGVPWQPVTRTSISQRYHHVRRVQCDIE